MLGWFGRGAYFIFVSGKTTVPDTHLWHAFRKQPMKVPGLSYNPQGWEGRGVGVHHGPRVLHDIEITHGAGHLFSQSFAFNLHIAK